MLLFSPPPCNLPFGSRRSRIVKQSSVTPTSSPRFTLPLWPIGPTDPPHNSPASKPHRQKSPPTLSKQQAQLVRSFAMSFHPGTPWSPFFEPTLGSIPEVFEYEPLDEQASSMVLHPGHETPEALTPESSTIAEPKLSRATSRSAIIQSPPRRVISALSVAKVLRRVLEADLMRRRKIMRVYLKAIMFLKYLWRANERYGTVMLTSGMYMPR